MKPGPGASKGPAAVALSLGAEALSCVGLSRALLVPRFSPSGTKCLSALSGRSLCRWREESSLRATPAGGPGTTPAQDRQQPLARGLQALRWFLGCVLVSVCCEGRPVHRSLSGLCVEDPPRGVAPVLLFPPCSLPSQYIEL